MTYWVPSPAAAAAAAAALEEDPPFPLSSLARIFMPSADNARIFGSASGNSPGVRKDIGRAKYGYALFLGQ